MRGPDQRLEDQPGRVVMQSRLPVGARGKLMLHRVFVDVDRTPAEVVTAYLASKIEKY
jgi:hypothetical protein